MTESRASRADLERMITYQTINDELPKLPASPSLHATIIQEPSAALLLCDLCQSCFAEPLAYNWWAYEMKYQTRSHKFEDATYTWYHHSNYKSWQASIDQGCYLCTFLHSTVPAHLLSILQLDESRKIYKGVERLFLWQVLIPSDRDESNRDIFRIKIEPCIKPGLLSDSFILNSGPRYLLRISDAHSTKKVKDLGDSTNSHYSWALVAKWLKTCREQHVSCSEKDGDDRSWYPTRLLELGFGPSGEDVVKLIETAYVKPDGDYITLSHCWGKKTLIRTLRENLQDFLIQLPSLPNTFQDAILATRMLGVRYIWIDSLCIIQDNADDWAKEASLMHKVYKNAMCNLSASASRNSNEGLFRPRTPRFLSKLRIKLRNTDYDVIEEHLFDREVEDAPLQQRAWVLQERLLSPRIIHFGHSQLSWECNELCACELFPDGLPDDLHYNGKLQLSYLIQAAASQTELSKFNQVKFRIWDHVLQSYFKRNITFQSDILPALSGVAKHIGNLLGDTYLAGIWKNDSTMFQLGWHCTGELSSRPDYRAPTWSWVSVDSHSSVQAARPKDSDRIDKSGEHFYCGSLSKIVDNQIYSAGDDIFSHVKDGYITVEGPLNHISIRSGIGYLDEIKMKIEFDVLFDIPEDLYIFYLYHDDELDYSEDWENGDFRYYYVYLVLTTSPKHPNSYERCGLATAQYFDPYSRRLHLEPPVDVRNGEKLACEKYLGKERGHRFRIY